MRLRSVLTLLPPAAFSLLFATSAGAQVTLNLTTSDQSNCVAVTDAQGLRLVPNGTDLQATGVTLSGDGCGGAGGGNFAATVSAPSQTTAGTPFTVAWSASAQATQCTYGGSSGASGWPVGQSACAGAACSGPHNQSVTVPSAGSYAFTVTCTNASGFAQSSTTSTGQAVPPQPNPFTLTTPASGTVGLPFDVSWSVTNASTCTGTASLNGSSVTLPGWTNSTSAVSPRSVTPSQPGTYSLQMHCDNPAGTATSNVASVVVTTPSTDSCAIGRQQQATMCYTYTTTGSSCVSSDVTKFENIWGRYWINSPGSISTPPVIFPGVNYYNVIANLNKTGYIAAKFTVPAGLPTNQVGLMTHPENIAGPNLTVAISPNCGDFNPSPTICVFSNRGVGSTLAKWKVSTAPASTVACPLVAGQSYFVNVKIADPATCAGVTCAVSTQSNHTP